MESLKLFYSYSHKDEKFREALETHLKLMARKGIIFSWHDRKITAGEEWKKLINQEIRSADIILLLISSDFIASDYCYENELEIAMELHESNQAIVIPIILRPSDWTETTFSKLQALPKDARAISIWDSEDEAWLDVVCGLKAAFEKINNLKSRKKEDSNFHDINDLLKSEIQAIDAAFRTSLDNRRTIRGIPTGFLQFDTYLDGLHPSDLTVVASRSQLMRSSLALQIASNIATSEKRGVGYFSFNYSAEQLIRTLLISEGKIPNSIIANAMLEESHWPSLSSAVGKIKDCPLYIEDNVSLTLDEIKQKSIALIKEKDIALIIIDGTETLFFNEKEKSQENDAYSVSKKLSLMAKTLNVSLVITSGIDRRVDQRIDKRPMLKDLHSSGTLDELSDKVVFLYRDDIYDEQRFENESIEVNIAKNDFVNTNTGSFFLNFYPQLFRFEDDIALHKTPQDNWLPQNKDGS